MKLFCLLLLTVVCTSADTDKTSRRDESLKIAVVDLLYQIDASAGEYVDSFRVISVDDLSEKAFIGLWMERIKLGLMFTDRRLKMFDQELAGNKSKYGREEIDSIKNIRNNILAHYSLQQFQLDSCTTAMMYADTETVYGQLTHIYRMFRSKKGVFLKGEGQYLVTRDMRAEPYYEHNDTMRLMNDFIMESRRYMRVEVDE